MGLMVYCSEKKKANASKHISFLGHNQSNHKYKKHIIQVTADQAVFVPSYSYGTCKKESIAKTIVLLNF